MSSLSFDLKGITSPITVRSEYTDTIVNGFYTDRYNTISGLFELDINPPTATYTDDDVEDLWEALSELKLGAVNGIDTATGQPVPSGQDPVGKRAFYTYGMAQSLDELLKSLESVGFDTVTPPIRGDASRIDQLETWQDLDDVGLREILIRMGGLVASNRTLQALVELEYVKAGNEILGENLEDLDEALNLTKDALDVLESAQLLKNKIDSVTREIGDVGDDPRNQDQWTVRTFDNPPNPSDPDAPDGESVFPDASSYNDIYERKMVTAFNEPLGVELQIEEADLTEFIKTVSDLGQIRAQLLELNPNSPLIESIDTVLRDMMRIPDGEPVYIPDVDYNFGGVAEGDIQPIEDSLNQLLFWVYDGYSASNQNGVESGNFQRNLTGAITAAQNLNDTQKEDLRRFMYLFEQFYKSASAILQAIDRMVNKMAQNIKG